MDSWKSFGVFLSGLAAIITAVAATIATTVTHLSKDITENKSSAVLQQLAIVDDPDGWVNVRKTSSVTSDIIFKIDNQQIVSIISKENNWYKIKTTNNQIGFIYYDRLELIYEDHYIKK